jgi:type IV pilus assembly protein PilC
MRARRLFWEGLAALLQAGIPIRSALEDLAAKAGGSFGEAVGHLRDEARRGRPLADAMEERPGAFRRMEVEILRAAEIAGTVDRAAVALAAEEESAERLRRDVMGAVLYPLAVLHFAPVPVNIGTLMAGKPVKFLLLWIACLLPLWALMGLAAWLLREARRGGGAARAVEAVPFFGGILRDAALVRWARTLAAMDDAGLGADRSAEGAARATGLASLERGLSAPADALRHGTSRAQAYAAAPLPQELYIALCTGETAGSLGASLRKSAELLEHGVHTRIRAALALLPVFATIVAGIAVLLAGMKVIGDVYGPLKGIK